ncbi:hypothetical protein [Sulfuriroseicoccus oceanibius]|uniref:Uncharacterized protein n=1 Tax=Sulfuriroseicoccus oceanibius TaxID=2707525 RepID=A0A6B3L3K5_9BACT|nr:hypothetical protein [Sulfuriroseicoccus oceanibius]QQL46078.1 hypothetical protein G3M56_005720 [Sulfuriroseicoccus oceanibius]
MIVLGVTILISMCLAGIFIVCFAVEAKSPRRSSPERDSLLPLDESDGREVSLPKAAGKASTPRD